jgi:hypothetical protein
MLAFRTVQQSNHCVREEFLYELKAGLRAAASGGPPLASRPPSCTGMILPTLRSHARLSAVRGCPDEHAMGHGSIDRFRTIGEQFK